MSNATRFSNWKVSVPVPVRLAVLAVVMWLIAPNYAGEDMCSAASIPANRKSFLAITWAILKQTYYIIFVYVPSLIDTALQWINAALFRFLLSLQQAHEPNY